MDNPREFVIRQYAHLVANGVSGEAARMRLGNAFGDEVMAFLDARRRDGDADKPDVDEPLSTLLNTIAERGGHAADAQAAFVHSRDEASLFALDWWRPARTFLLYITFLLAFAVVIALLYMLWVLPAFQGMDRMMAMRGGMSGWILSWGAIRLFAPLIVIAIGLVVLTVLWRCTRQRIAALRPLPCNARWPWLYGASGVHYRALLGLEYVAILHAGGVAGEAAVERALPLAGWPPEKSFDTADGPLGYVLEQARRVGTFEAELQWQRRLCWLRTQGRLEMSRDRLILATRVLFYILIGCMVTVLYLPIFSIASFFGAY